MRAIIVCGYGINADLELAEAFRLAGAEARRVHVRDLIDEPALLTRAEFLGFPGGFSFGDHLGSGLVLAGLFSERLGPELKAFVADGGLAIGICNGFQTLVKAGILPNSRGDGRPEATLLHNDRGRFVDDWVPVRFEEASRCVWTRGLKPRMLPIRHGEGRFVAADEAALARIEGGGLVALRYDGADPNGSVNAIAGVCDPTGRVLGLMPHPEAFIHPEAHPHWRRGSVGGLGLELFKKAVAWKAANG